MEEVYKMITKTTGVSKQDIQSKSRDSKVVQARALFIILGHKVGKNFSALGKEINRDHTTALHHYHSKKDLPYYTSFIQSNLENIDELKSGPFREHFEGQKLRFTSLSNRKRPYQIIYKKYNGKCMVCLFDEVVEIHHVIPKYLGGEDNEENLILLCPNHHALADRGMLQIKGVMELIHTEPSYPHS